MNQFATHDRVFLSLSINSLVCVDACKWRGDTSVRQVWSCRWWGGEVGWFRDEAFADSIFTHQTEVFPVSTRPNSRSHHLALFAALLFCFVFFYPLPAALPAWRLSKPPLTPLFSSLAVYSAQLLSQSTAFFLFSGPALFFHPPPPPFLM